MTSASGTSFQALDQEKLLTYLKEVEEAAENVLSQRQEIIDLDRRRHRTREAMTALKKAESDKCWVAMGNCFLKLPMETTKTMLNKVIVVSSFFHRGYPRFHQIHVTYVYIYIFTYISNLAFACVK